MEPKDSWEAADKQARDFEKRFEALGYHYDYNDCVFFHNKACLGTLRGPEQVAKALGCSKADVGAWEDSSYVERGLY